MPLDLEADYLGSKRATKLTNKYIMVFGKLGVYAGFLSGLLFTLRYGLFAGIKMGLMAGILLSFTVFVIYLVINSFPGNKLPPDALDIMQVRYIKVKGTLANAFESCARVLDSIDFIKKKSIRKDENRITANDLPQIIVPYSE